MRYFLLQVGPDVETIDVRINSAHLAIYLHKLVDLRFLESDSHHQKSLELANELFLVQHTVDTGPEQPDDLVNPLLVGHGCAFEHPLEVGCNVPHQIVPPRHSHRLRKALQ